MARPKGSPNKVTADLRAMVLGALEDAGGQAYLARQAEDNPAAFLSLVGKCMPRDVQVTGALTLEQLLMSAIQPAGMQAEHTEHPATAH